MPAFLPVILAGSYVVLAANQIPKFDTDGGCRAAIAAATVVNRSEDACRKDEHDARAKLEQQWAHFTPAQQMRCMSLSKLGGFPSYVELLTCLEIAADAKKLPPADRLTGGAAK
jgi:hypothetical protein